MRSLILVWLFMSTAAACGKKPKTKDSPAPPPTPPMAEASLTAEPQAPAPKRDTSPEQPPVALPSPSPDPVPAPLREPALHVTETQFWVYETDFNGKLTFNFPWDKIPGSDAIHDPNDPKLPPHAKVCGSAALEALNDRLLIGTIASRLDTLTALGATAQVSILVNVISSAKHRPDLVALDRDAYFWHLNSMKERPSLAMSRFNEGRWMWEVISSPDEGCMMPSQEEMIRYLDYAAARLASKKEGA